MTPEEELALAVLTNAEWCSWSADPFCPVCEWWKSEGHGADCRLKQALDALERKREAGRLEQPCQCGHHLKAHHGGPEGQCMECDCPGWGPHEAGSSTVAVQPNVSAEVVILTLEGYGSYKLVPV